MSAITRQIMHLVSTNLNQISKSNLRTKSGRQLFDSFSNHTACENTCSHFLIWSKAGWEKTGFEYFLCFVLSPNMHGPRRYIILHSWSENNTSIVLYSSCTAIYRHVCVHIYFVEVNISFTFLRKGSTLFLSTCKSFSLWSLGRLLPATCSSSWHANVANWAISLGTVHSRLLQRLSEMMTLSPQEKLSPTRVPPTAYGRAWMLARKMLPRFLNKLQCGSSKTQRN